MWKKGLVELRPSEFPARHKPLVKKYPRCRLRASAHRARRLHPPLSRHAASAAAAAAVDDCEEGEQDHSDVGDDDI